MSIKLELDLFINKPIRASSEQSLELLTNSSIRLPPLYTFRLDYYSWIDGIHITSYMSVGM